MSISFAHRTFQWTNDAPGKAAVHCVIIGFGREAVQHKQLFEYADIKGQPHEIAASNINPYLVDAADILLQNRSKPICTVPGMNYGSKPTDGGNLLLSLDEKNDLLTTEPQAEKWVRPFMGAEEFINNITRFCLWLKEISPSELAKLPEVQKRVKAVHEMRLASTKKLTIKSADFPTLFGEERQPRSNYLLIPSVSSEQRKYIPIGFLSAETVLSNANFAIPNATLYHFGILTSTMHNAWVRQVCGRLESRYRYSNTIVYNNFPWPVIASDAVAWQSIEENTNRLPRHDVPRNDPRVSVVEQAAQAVLDARALFPNESLANLYNSETMPPTLVKAHATLDRAVDAAYVADGGAKSYASDAERVAFLFKRYQQLTSLI